MMFIQTPHLAIKKMVVDPDHTKNVIVNLLSQILRNAGQTENFDLCILVVINGEEHKIHQPLLPNEHYLFNAVWSLYWARGKEIRKRRWGVLGGRKFGDDPSLMRIIFTIDSKDYDFDVVKYDAADQLRDRINNANHWLEAHRQLRNKDLIYKGSNPFNTEESAELFHGYDLQMQLYLVDHIYENVKRNLGQERLDKIKAMLI